MKLDLSSLGKAIDSLERALMVTERKISSAGEAVASDEVEVVKAGVIQNFEFTYELCWKFIQRWVRENVNPEEADHPRTRKELFRIAAAHGLVADPLPWFTYSEKRNLTSHTYDQEVAQEVYETALVFFPDARYLFHQLEASNDRS